MKIISRLWLLAIFLTALFLSAPSFAADDTGAFSEEIEIILSKKAMEFQIFLQDQEIRAAVHAANEEHEKITLKKILELDKRFRAAAVTDPWIQGFMTNACAKRLALYQKDHPGYAELFITDRNGLNVAQTNKTSDYYQADEEWWAQAYQKGDGKVYHGDIEFDESSESQSVALYTPIMEGNPPKAIGVAKAVLNISQIQEEL